VTKAPLQVLVLSTAACLLSVLLHDLGYALAAELGRSIRGGVGWGGLLCLAFAAFILLALVQNLAALRWPARRTSIALAVWLVFAVVFTLLGDPFGSWGHPYRFLYLLLCAGAGFGLSLAGQNVLLRRIPSAAMAER
jgi:hypothetical protein